MLIFAKSFKYWFLILGLVFVGQSAFACPCGVGYNYYYLIIHSGLDREKVLEQGQQISKNLGHPFSFAGASLKERRKGCGANAEKCMILLTSDDEPIGKSGWTTPGSKTDQKTFAAAYVFDSYDSQKNKKSAEALRRKIQTRVKDAYLKAMDACACE